MIKVRVCILWLKAGVYSREAKTMDVGMEGEGDPNKEHLENMFFTEPNEVFEEECRSSTGQGCKLRRWMAMKAMNHKEERDEKSTENVYTLNTPPYAQMGGGWYKNQNLLYFYFLHRTPTSL